MPSLILDPDAIEQERAVHYYWSGSDDGVRTACNITLKRDGAPIRATSQAGDVTCEECSRTLKAAGIR